jgi:hypothetical protein
MVAIFTVLMPCKMAEGGEAKSTAGEDALVVDFFFLLPTQPWWGNVSQSPRSTSVKVTRKYHGEAQLGPGAYEYE